MDSSSLMARKARSTRVVPLLSNTGSSFSASMSSISSSLSSQIPWPAVRGAAAAGSGGFVVGTQLAILSGLLEMKSFSDVLAPETSDKARLSAAYIAGAIAASFQAGSLVDRHGRRRALLAVSIVTLLSCIIMAGTSDSSMFLVARLLAGAAFAVINVAVPMYASEIAPTNLRGKFVGLYQLAITGGVLFAQLANVYVVRNPEVGFHLSLNIARVPSLFMLIAVYLYAPETPAWLESRGRFAEASSSRLKLGLPNASSSRTDEADNADRVIQSSGVSDAIVDLETAELSGPAASENGRSRTLSDENDGKIFRSSGNPSKHTGFDSMLGMLSNPSARRRLAVAVGVQVGQQLTGVNSVIFYAPTMLSNLFGNAGLSPDTPFLAAAGIGLINLIATIVSFAMVERTGRVKLLLSTAVPMILSLVLLSVVGVFSLAPATSIFAILMFICAFAVGWGPVPFLLSSEVFPISYRGRGMTLSSLVMNVTSLAVTGSFLHLHFVLGGGIFALYGICTIVSALFVWRVVPETRNVPLERIDAMFQ